MLEREIRETENKNTLPDHAPPEKASECVVRQRLCREWSMSFAYPGSIGASPEGGLISLTGLRVSRAGRGLQAGSATPRSFSLSCLGD
jgi:hypothetical protein